MTSILTETRKTFARLGEKQKPGCADSRPLTKWPVHEIDRRIPAGERTGKTKKPLPQKCDGGCGSIPRVRTSDFGRVPMTSDGASVRWTLDYHGPQADLRAGPTEPVAGLFLRNRLATVVEAPVSFFDPVLNRGAGRSVTRSIEILRREGGCCAGSGGLPRTSPRRLALVSAINGSCSCFKNDGAVINPDLRKISFSNVPILDVAIAIDTLLFQKLINVDFINF